MSKPKSILTSDKYKRVKRQTFLFKPTAYDFTVDFLKHALEMCHCRLETGYKEGRGWISLWAGWSLPLLTVFLVL